MKSLSAGVVILMVIGVLGLVLSGNQKYVSDQEYLSTQEESDYVPYACESQRQFNFWTGLISTILGSGFLVFLAVLSLRSRD